MSAPAYPAYKDTGTQWLGQIPESWTAIPFGALFRRTKRVGFADEELLSVYRDYGVIRKSDRDDNFNNASEDLSTYQLVEPGDLAMNKMKAWQGSLGISSHRGIVSPAYFVFSPRQEFHPQFLHHLLRSPPYAAGYMTISKGIRINQWDVDPDHLSSLPVLFPSFSEQTAIAAFLDRETAKIDGLVAEQERLIALLKEKRQAVINHAVTKGLNPNAPMQDSCIAWLGEIPAHWGVRKLRDLTSRIGDGLHGTPEYDDSEPYYFINGTNLSDGHIRITESTRGVSERTAKDHWIELSENSILMSINGTIGNIALWRGESVILGKSAAYINCGHRIDRQFLLFVLQGDPAKEFFKSTMANTTINNLSLEAIRSLRVGLPTMTEQREIVSALTSEMASIEEVTRASVEVVALLQERRAALISAAVTGKIDVRGLVTPSDELEAA